jgi:hypothetical protein
MTIQYQRQQLQEVQPRYVLNMSHLAGLHQHLQQAMNFINRHKANSQLPPQNPPPPGHQPLPGSQPPPPTRSPAALMAPIARPQGNPMLQPPAVPQPPIPQPHPNTLAQPPPPPPQQPPPQPQPPLIRQSPNVLSSPKKKAQTLSQHTQQQPGQLLPSAPTPTTAPSPAMTTPGPSVPTPTHVVSSPQTPKSPKSKAGTKPKTKRRSSKSVSQTLEPPKPTIAAPSSPDPMSSAPAVTPATPTAPPVPSAVPTPPVVADQTPPRAPVIGEKRAREEDVQPLPPPPPPPASATTPNTMTSGEPLPKKVKPTEWGGPPSEAVAKKKQQVEDVKTEEDAQMFFNSVTDWLQQGGEPSEISEALEMLLKGCTSDTEASSPSLAPFGLGDSGQDPLASSSSVVQPMDEFHQFFDFSSYQEDNAATPALTSSSTNLSPASAPEADSSHHGSTSAPDTAAIADPKKEQQFDLSSSLQLGIFREIDRGESAYYQPPELKWDGPPPELESPWAILPA